MKITERLNIAIQFVDNYLILHVKLKATCSHYGVARVRREAGAPPCFVQEALGCEAILHGNNDATVPNHHLQPHGRQLTHHNKEYICIEKCCFLSHKQQKRSEVANRRPENLMSFQIHQQKFLRHGNKTNNTKKQKLINMRATTKRIAPSKPETSGQAQGVRLTNFRIA
jgi:hypothetical protein